METLLSPPLPSGPKPGKRRPSFLLREEVIGSTMKELPGTFHPKAPKSSKRMPRPCVPTCDQVSDGVEALPELLAGGVEARGISLDEPRGGYGQVEEEADQSPLAFSSNGREKKQVRFQLDSVAERPEHAVYPGESEPVLQMTLAQLGRRHQQKLRVIHGT
ncbi:unnamed protein product [Durusdinium trenchii]|uniref:Uncharacterized protein n=1 Tax=Durusdinium trenchii TaxID=1381693 RepID=A0ABP0I4T4_9DINO